MAETLFILLEEPLHWHLATETGAIKQSGTADDLPTVSEGFTGPAVALAPASQILRTTAEVPSSQPRQIQQAVPFLVEERLAADVEDCFFALGGRNAAGAVQVAVVAKAQLQAWAQTLQALDCPVPRLHSYADLIPADDGVTALLDGDTAIIRWGQGETLVTGKANLATVVGLAPQEEPAKLRLVAPEADLKAIRLQLKALEADDALEVQVIRLKKHESPLAWCLANYQTRKAAPAINLLQGPYKVRRPRASLPPAWRRVAALAGGALALHLLLQLGQGLYLSAEASRYRAQAQALYQQVFPEDHNVRDHRRRWNARLGRASAGGSDFLGLFAQAAVGLEAAGVKLVSVNFNEARGDLLLQVEAPGSDALVAYTQALASNGLDAEIGSISQEGARVRGRVRVTGTP